MTGKNRHFRDLSEQVLSGVVAPKTSKTTSSSNRSDADHAEDATSGISDDGIILLLCMNLSSFDNKSITYF